MKKAESNFDQGSSNFSNKGPLYCPSDFRRAGLWPAGAGNVTGPASVRINMASGLVVNRRRSISPISKRDSILSLVSVEYIVPQWEEQCLQSVGGILPQGPDKG